MDERASGNVLHAWRNGCNGPHCHGRAFLASPFGISTLDVLACLSPIVPILKAASGPLTKRLERIFQMRSKKRAQEEMHAEKREQQGDVAVTIVYRTCVICDAQFDEDQGVFCCGVPRENVDTHSQGHPGTGAPHHHLGLHLPGVHAFEEAEEENPPPHFTCSGKAYTTQASFE